MRDHYGLPEAKTGFNPLDLAAYSFKGVDKILPGAVSLVSPAYQYVAVC